MAEYRSQLSDLEPLLAADPDNAELQEVCGRGVGGGRGGQGGEGACLPAAPSGCSEGTACPAYAPAVSEHAGF